MSVHVDESNARGSYRVARLDGEAVWFEFDGWISGDWWGPSEQLLEETIREHGAVLMLGNGLAWRGYEPSFRVQCTRWFSRRRRELRGVHLLASAPILRMGIQVVNLVAPVIHPYGDTGEFMTAANQHVPQLATQLLRAGLRSPGA